jgi:hypothetical protein
MGSANNMIAMRRKAPWLTLGIAACFAVLLAAGCGCTNEPVSDLEMDPPTPCLDLTLPRYVSNCAAGSYNPDLTLSGTNHCDATVIIPGEYRDYPHAGEDLVVLPGGAVSYDVDWTFSGTNDFAIPCALGDATVILNFSVY